MLAGCIVASQLSTSPDAFWYAWLPLSLWLALVNKPLRSVWLLLSAFLWCSFTIALQLQQRLPPDLHNKEITVEGEVISLPRNSPSSIRFVFAPRSEFRAQGLPTKIRLSWREPAAEILPGQVWRLRVRLKPAHGFQNPGGFDYERWLFVNRIAATGYVATGHPVEMLQTDDVDINRWRHAVNQWIHQRCSDCMHVGVIQALSTGFRGGMSQQVRDLLQDTGTAHLIAISGLHIGIVAGFFYWLGIGFWRLVGFRYFRDRRDFALLLGWIAAAAYALLSGMALPAQRAFIMLTVVALIRWLRLPLNLPAAIMTSLVVVLTYSPMSVLSESFWLTYSALAIIVLAVFLQSTASGFVFKLVQLQLLFSLLLVTVTLLVFNQVHSASLFANLVAVPVISFIVVPAVFLLLLLFWLPQEWLQVLYQMLDLVLAGVLGFLDRIRGIGFEAIEIGLINGWQIVLLLLWLLLLVLPKGVARIRHGLWLLPIILLVSWLQQQDTPELAVSILDVGMGTSVVVETRHHHLVYDFGPGNRNGFSLGQWVVEPFLRTRRVALPDRLIISHADQDHMGGLYGLLDRYAEIAVSSGTPQMLRQKMPELQRIDDCHQQSPWRWDGVEFEFLSMHTAGLRGKNNRSCILRISSGQTRVLIAGDIEASLERQLIVRHGAKLKADILVTPHHGSLTSSSKSFIHAVNPRYAVHTVGFLNRWKFPRPEIEERYRQAGALQYRTDRDGAVLVECRQAGCSVGAYRQQNPRIWY